MKTEEETQKFYEMITELFVKFCTDEEGKFSLDDVEGLLDLFYLGFKDAIKGAIAQEDILQRVRDMIISDKLND